MEMTRISVPMTIEERETLRAMAERELRHPRDHARYLILSALGLRESDQARTQPQTDSVQQPQGC